MYRIKFRVLSRTEKVESHRAENGELVNRPVLRVALLPVTAKNKWAEDGSEENKLFWSASPSGECEVTLSPEDAVDYRIGQAFYIDFEPSQAGTWVLQSYTQHLGGQFDVAFYPPNWGGHLKVNVERAETVEALRRDIAPVVDAIVRAKVEHPDVSPTSPRWAVVFSPAPG